MQDSYPSYPLLSGLQKPLEFKGIRGRFLGWMAGIVGTAAMGTLILLSLTSLIVGLVFLVITVGGGYLILRIKQKQGLHNKKKSNDTLVYHNLFKIRR